MSQKNGISRKNPRCFTAIAVVFLLLFGYLAYRMVCLGAFDVEPPLWLGQVKQLGRYAGPEDLSLTAWGDVIISSDARVAGSDDGVGELGLSCLHRDGDAYVLKKIQLESPRDFHPHGIDVVSISESESYLFAVNHRSDGTHSIERFAFSGRFELVHEKTYDSKMLTAPNDIVAIDRDRFYVSNEGPGREKFDRSMAALLTTRKGTILYCADGIFNAVAAGLIFPNGIAWSPRHNSIYVSDTVDGKILLYRRAESGALVAEADIEIGSGLDNLNIGHDGKLWVARHQNLIKLAQHRRDAKAPSPSIVYRLDLKMLSGKVVFADNGTLVSGATAVMPLGDDLLIASIRGPHISIVSLKE